MKLSFSEYPRTERSRFTRICIGKAVAELMEEKPFEDIRVTDIVHKAGVSRMTYYKYYNSKLEVLKDYLSEIFLQYDCMQKSVFLTSSPEKEQILQSLLFFEQYASLFQTLLRTNQHSILMQAILQYAGSRLNTGVMNDYQIYFYTGAFSGVFFRWLENAKKETPQELAEILCSMIHSDRSEHTFNDEESSAFA